MVPTGSSVSRISFFLGNWFQNICQLIVSSLSLVLSSFLDVVGLLEPVLDPGLWFSVQFLLWVLSWELCLEPSTSNLVSFIYSLVYTITSSSTSEMMLGGSLWWP